jgi:hypothetical protein
MKIAQRLVSVNNTPPEFFFDNPTAVRLVKVKIA